MPLSKNKNSVPITACQWINEAIQNTYKTASSYRKIMEAIEQRKIKETEAPEAVFLFGLSDEEESALRTIKRIEAQERSHLDLLGMVKRDLKCEQ